VRYVVNVYVDELKYFLLLEVLTSCIYV